MILLRACDNGYVTVPETAKLRILPGSGATCSTVRAGGCVRYRTCRIASSVIRHDRSAVVGSAERNHAVGRPRTSRASGRPPASSPTSQAEHRGMPRDAMCQQIAAGLSRLPDNGHLGGLFLVHVSNPGSGRANLRGQGRGVPGTAGPQPHRSEAPGQYFQIKKEIFLLARKHFRGLCQLT